MKVCVGIRLVRREFIGIVSDSEEDIMMRCEEASEHVVPLLIVVVRIAVTRTCDFVCLCLCLQDAPDHGGKRVTSEDTQQAECRAAGGTQACFDGERLAIPTES